MRNEEPAFPTYGSKRSGMDIRDYFAAKAMVALLGAMRGNFGADAFPGLAAFAYKMADAMLAERDK